MIGEEFKTSGLTENTPKHILLGAGTVHKGLRCTEGVWNFAESLMCATSGGSKVTIVPEFTDIDVDGAMVKVMGMTVKTGETATMEIKPVEVTPALLEMLLVGQSKSSDSAAGYNEITPRAALEQGDYVENLAYVGKTLEGRPVIILFDYALCTSGLSLEGKNKEAANPTCTFQCMAEPEADTRVLPWHIYYPSEG